MDSEFGQHSVNTESYVFIENNDIPVSAINEASMAQNRARRIQHQNIVMMDTFGTYNIKRTNVGSWLYLSDLYRTMLHWRWYWIAIAVLFAYLLQFTLFGGVYTLLSDLKVVGENDSCPNRSCYCMPDITTFEEAFFFSVQTQITIGYGDMIPNPRCTLAIFAVIAQSMVGLTADAMLFGLIYQRFSRPQKNARHLVFSEIATIGTRNRQRCFMFRLANMRSTQLLNPRISVYTTSFYQTEEGEEVYSFKPLKIQEADLFLALPVIVTHVIDESSPFYNMNYDDMAQSNIQVIILLDGVEASTSDQIQARHTYTANDIMLERRFDTMVRLHKGVLFVDYAKLNETVPIPDHIVQASS